MALSRCAGAVLASLLVSVVGCASYSPRPLPERPSLVDLAQATESVSSSTANAYPFDPANGLDWIEVAMLAVANNPELAADRARTGIEAAQVYAARLLPDPELGVAGFRPTGNAPGKVGGFDIEGRYALSSLVARGALVASRQAAERRIHLELLWREWQVIQRAHVLVVQIEANDRQIEVLDRALAVARERLERSRTLLQAHETTGSAVGVVAAAWSDVRRQLDRARSSRQQGRLALATLLGLAPDVKLQLTLDTPPPRPPVERDLSESLDSLARRRPDLLALQAGYEEQEARVRAAILAQFPMLKVGLLRARDTDGVSTTGLGVRLSLPMFSGNRGQIAVERATREQLRAEYDARLSQAWLDVEALATRREMLEHRREALGRSLPILERLGADARSGYGRGDLTDLQALDVDRRLLDARLEEIGLEQALAQVEIALDTLLARPGALRREERRSEVSHDD